MNKQYFIFFSPQTEDKEKSPSDPLTLSDEHLLIWLALSPSLSGFLHFPECLSTTSREGVGFLCWIVLGWEPKCVQVFIDESRNRTSSSTGGSQRDYSGLIFVTRTHCVLVSSALVSSGLVWSGLVQSGLVWSHLIWSGLVCTSTDSCSSSCWSDSWPPSGRDHLKKAHMIHTNHQEGQSQIRFDSSCLLNRNSPFLKLLESACETERKDRREETDIHQNPSEMEYIYFLLFSWWDMNIQHVCKIWDRSCFCITTKAASIHGQKTS